MLVLRPYISRILLYIGHSISCADQTSAQVLRYDGTWPIRHPCLNWPFENVLFPTHLRCVLSRSLVAARLEAVPSCKSKSLGGFLGLLLEKLLGASKLYTSLLFNHTSEYDRASVETSILTSVRSCSVFSALLKAKDSVLLRRTYLYSLGLCLSQRILGGCSSPGTLPGCIL